MSPRPGDRVALFNATPGTAPKYAGQDKVNPGSLSLSAEIMLRQLGWVAAADLIIKGCQWQCDHDLARLMDGVREVSCSGFGDVLIERL